VTDGTPQHTALLADTARAPGIERSVGSAVTGLAAGVVHKIGVVADTCARAVSAGFVLGLSTAVGLTAAVDRRVAVGTLTRVLSAAAVSPFGAGSVANTGIAGAREAGVGSAAARLVRGAESCALGLAFTAAAVCCGGVSATRRRIGLTDAVALSLS
jgi:hypothetical protein